MTIYFRIDIYFYDDISSPLWNKGAPTSLSIRLSVYPNQAFSLGTLIIFENNFLLNLAVMLVCSENNLQQ
jgi:hypothetical protein